MAMLIRYKRERRLDKGQRASGDKGVSPEAQWNKIKITK